MAKEKESKEIKSDLNSEIEELQESINTHSKLLSNWKDELKVEQERLIAILRNIVREEDKLDSFTIKLRELQEKSRGEEIA